MKYNAKMSDCGFSLLFSMKNLIFLFLLLLGCDYIENEDTIKFGTSSDYPPFEYIKQEKLSGFDIELAEIIAQKLNKKIQFYDMQFPSIFMSLKNGTIDAAISTITKTTEREKHFDFSIPYYKESMAILFNKHRAILKKEDLENKNIACQIGTVMESWLRKNFTNVNIITMNSNLEAVESLKTNQIDGIIIDSAQAMIFAKMYPSIGYKTLDGLRYGYVVALQKGSKLKESIDIIIKNLIADGTIEALKDKYIK